MILYGLSVDVYSFDWKRFATIYNTMCIFGKFEPSHFYFILFIVKESIAFIIIAILCQESGHKFE